MHCHRNCTVIAETRALFARFRLEAVETRYTIAGGEWANAAEILVMGPHPDGRRFW